MEVGWIGRYGFAGVASAVVALVVVVSAAADKQKIRFTAAGQAAAKAAMLRRSDLGSATGWRGGALKPNLSSSACSNFDPKESDLVLNGAAETKFVHSGLEFDSEAQVLQTARMVQLDWQRQIPDPRFLPCLREAALKGATSNEKLISVSRRRFPRMATFTASFRILFDVTLGATKVRVFVDAVFLGKGRTELTLTTIGPLVAESALSTAELRLATLLVSRIRI